MFENSYDKGHIDSTPARAVPICTIGSLNACGIDRDSPEQVETFPYEVIQIRDRGRVLGLVYAENEQEAKRLAVIDYKISRLAWLIIRKV